MRCSTIYSHNGQDFANSRNHRLQEQTISKLGCLQEASRQTETTQLVIVTQMIVQTTTLGAIWAASKVEEEDKARQEIKIKMAQKKLLI